MELVDTHCHIQSAGTASGERSTADMWAKLPGVETSQLVADAVAAAVTKMICVGCDLPDSTLAITCAEQHTACFASIGLHPHEAHRYADDIDALAQFDALATKPKVVAIGECGLDYFYEHSPREQQIKILRHQLLLAQRMELPVIFHVREAFDDFWPILDEYPSTRGVLHSYTDSMQNLSMAVERGLYIGVNGIATFTRQDSQLAMYKAIPLQKLLLETDSPFLTPTPYRGKVNEPKRVGTIAEFFANLRGEDLVQLAAATTRSAHDLFGL